jgi:hypothetical protein
VTDWVTQGTPGWSCGLSEERRGLSQEEICLPVSRPFIYSFISVKKDLPRCKKPSLHPKETTA